MRGVYAIRPALETGDRHSLPEDVLGILLGAFLVSFGIVLYARATVLVGGIVGMAQLLAHVSPVEVWLGLLLLNLPFFCLAWRDKGRGFVLRTILAVILESALTREIRIWIDIAAIDPVFATLSGGALIGLGLMCLFRHATTVGGIGILAQYLQEHHNIRAGYVQLATDFVILLAAAAVLPAQNLVLSIAGAVVMNGVLIIHHRSDRYVGVT